MTANKGHTRPEYIFYKSDLWDRNSAKTLATAVGGPRLRRMNHPGDGWKRKASRLLRLAACCRGNALDQGQGHGSAPGHPTRAENGPSKRPLTFEILHLKSGGIHVGWERLLWDICAGSDQRRTSRWLRYHPLGPHGQVGGSAMVPSGSRSCGWRLYPELSIKRPFDDEFRASWLVWPHERTVWNENASFQRRFMLPLMESSQQNQ